MIFKCAHMSSGSVKELNAKTGDMVIYWRCFGDKGSEVIYDGPKNDWEVYVKCKEHPDYEISVYACCVRDK